MVRVGLALLLGMGVFAACSGKTESTDTTAQGGAGGSGATGGASSGGSGGTVTVDASGGAGGRDAANDVTVTVDVGVGGARSCVPGDAGIDAGRVDRILASCSIAVVRVARIDEECSGAGGAHITFDVITMGQGTPVTSVAYGAHAYYPPPEGPNKVGEYFVAGIDPLPGLTPQPDDPGWCITGLPPIDGNVLELLEAADLPAAEALMNQILAP